MSASREKKQRQGGTSADRQMTAQQKEAAARRKTIQYTVIGVIVAIAVAALLIWNSGIFQRMAARNAVALTIGEHTYSPAEVSYYYYGNSTYQMYLSYGLISSGVDLRETAYPGSETEQTWHDYLVESATETLTQVSAVLDEAAAEGYTLSEEGQQTLQSNIDSMKESASNSGYSYSTYLRLVYGDYMTTEAFESCLEQQVLVNEYGTQWAEAQEISASDIESYYQENANTLDTFHYSAYTISGAAESTTDEDGNTVEPTDEESEAAMEEARQGAEQLAAALEAGEDVTDLVDELGATTNEDASATGSSLSSTYSEWLTDVTRQAGDVTVLESGTNVYVVVFNSREDYREVDNYLPANVRHIFIQAEVDEGASSPTDEQMAAAKTEAEDLLAQWQAGDATAESFAALAEEYSDDTGSNTNGGLYEGITKSTSFIANFIDWTFADGRQVGDTGIVENTTSGGYHVMYLDSYGDTPVWETSIRTTLQSEALTAHLDEITANYTATQGDGMKYVG